jgi:hypothetical protein
MPCKDSEAGGGNRAQTMSGLFVRVNNNSIMVMKLRAAMYAAETAPQYRGRSFRVGGFSKVLPVRTLKAKMEFEDIERELLRVKLSNLHVIGFLSPSLRSFPAIRLASVKSNRCVSVETVSRVQGENGIGSYSIISIQVFSMPIASTMWMSGRNSN